MPTPRALNNTPDGMHLARIFGRRFGIGGSRRIDAYRMESLGRESYLVIFAKKLVL
jgi:hypothetical protein